MLGSEHHPPTTPTPLWNARTFITWGQRSVGGSSSDRIRNRQPARTNYRAFSDRFCFHSIIKVPVSIYWPTTFMTSCLGCGALLLLDMTLYHQEFVHLMPLFWLGTWCGICLFGLLSEVCLSALCKGAKIRRPPLPSLFTLCSEDRRWTEWGKYVCVSVYVCVCVHVCTCMCMCVY